MTDAATMAAVKAVETHELVRKFRDFTAVKGVSFDVEQGEVFGFLGPNGAGKTTTISMLCTLLAPTSGSARIVGHDVEKEPGAVRQSIGMIFQDPSLDERLTGLENLRFHAMLYDVPGAVFKERSAELLEMVDLTAKADQVIRNFSGGMKRRLEIARGLLHHPKVLFLDEPTIGLDPQTRRHIWEYLLKLRQQQGVTMFMTTHYMDEAEHCDRIAVIDHGEIVALDTPKALKGRVGGDILTLQTSDNALAGERLGALDGVTTRDGLQGELILEVAHGDQFLPTAIQVLSDSGNGTPITVHSIQLKHPTLEDVFVKLTGHAIRESEAEGNAALRTQMRAWRSRGGGRR